MNKDLILALLRKNIQDLNILTESFMEMNELPPAILHLTMQKVDEIHQYLEELINESSSTAKPAGKEIFHSEDLKNKKENDFLHFSEHSTNDFAEPSENVSQQAEIEAIQEMKFQVGEENIAQEIEKTEFSFTESPINETITEWDETEKETAEIEHEPLENEKNRFVSTQPEIGNETTEITHSEVHEKEEPSANEGQKTAPTSIPLQEKFSKIPDNSLGSILANQKIDDIKKAISIGDRFRFQRELFRGNGEDMNKTLNYLNQLATFEEAVSFLQAKYKWDGENETVQDFFQILKRRFL